VPPAKMTIDTPNAASGAMRTLTSATNNSSSTDGSHKNLFNEELNIIYDSKCNVCKLEMDLLARRDAYINGSDSRKLKLTDLESASYDPTDAANGGVSYRDGMAEIHAVTSAGQVLKGIPVFTEAYQRVKLGWLFSMLEWRAVRPVADLGYTLFARYRTIVTRGSTLDSLVEAYEAKQAKTLIDESCETCPPSAMSQTQSTKGQAETTTNQ